MKDTLVFIHGLESTAQGTKGQFFQQNFPQMIIENYAGNLIMRMRELARILSGKADLVIVGSSYGGLMAVLYSMENESRVKKLILLAPALNLPEFAPYTYKTLKIPVIIYHGIDDNIVDPYIVKDIARKIFLQLEHYMVDDDHPLHKTFSLLDWKKLLQTDR